MKDLALEFNENNHRVHILILLGNGNRTKNKIPRGYDYEDISKKIKSFCWEKLNSGVKKLCL